MTVRRSAILIALLSHSLGCAASSPKVEPASAVAEPGEPPAGKLPEGVRPTIYALELKVDPEQPRFSGRVRIELELDAPAGHVWLHGRQLEVSEAFVVSSEGDKVPATYEERLSSGVALVSFARPVAGKVNLELAWTAPFDQALDGMYTVERDGVKYVATQLEPIAARKIFPSFDEPRFKVPFDVSLVTPEGMVAVSNTPEGRSVPEGEGWTRHEMVTTKPLPTYLLAFAVGPYDINDFGTLEPNAIRKTPLPLRAVVGEGLGARAQFALEGTDGLLSELESYFGSPYPYRKLDLISPPENFGGAMENAGAIMYGEYLLLLDAKAPLRQRRTHVVVHAHEMAHMWFGDLVTPKWWDDLWLNESFASWMMYEASEAYWPEGGFEREILSRALSAMRADSLAAARQIREPVTRNEAIADAFDAITYKKGGGVLAMLEAYAGPEAFREGVRLHMKRFAFDVADADDFMRSLAEGSGKPEIEPAFRSFIDQPGVPLVSVRAECTDEGAKLELRQGRYAPLGSSIEPESGLWTLPVCLKIDGSRRCVMLSERSSTETLESCPKQVHPNAGGAGYYRFSVDTEGWKSLARGAAELSGAEALVYADSLEAAFRAGQVEPEVMLDGLVALAAHPAWDVASRAVHTYDGLTGQLLEGEAVEAATKALGQSMFAPRYASMADPETAGDRLLKDTLHSFLALEVEDQAVRAELVPLARRYLGIDAAPESDAIDPNRLGTTLAVAMEEGAEGVFEALAKLAETSPDPAVRRAVGGALARAEAPERVDALLADVLAKRFPVQVSLQLVYGMLGHDATRDRVFAWMKSHATEVIQMIPGTFRSNFAGHGAVFCSAEEGEAWKSFIEAHAEEIPGYERSLAQALESVALCSQLKATRAAGLGAAVKRRI